MCLNKDRLSESLFLLINTIFKIKYGTEETTISD